MSNCSSEEFRVVTGKRRKCKKSRAWNFHGLEYINSNNIVDEDAVIKRLERIRTELKTTNYFTESLSTIEAALNRKNHPNLEKLVCLGLGTLSNCTAALYQLAFILELNESLSIKISEFYDPIFTDCDKNILKRLHCTLIKENCEGKYPVEGSTLFYLPHCPKQLTNNFLWKNWDKELLKKTVLICNSFDSLKRNTFDRYLQQDAEFIVRIFDYTDEYPLKNIFHIFDYFNDTSIHVFLEEKLNQIDTDFWLIKEEPKYIENETELITNAIYSKLNIIEQTKNGTIL